MYGHPAARNWAWFQEADRRRLLHRRILLAIVGLSAGVSMVSIAALAGFFRGLL